MIVDDEALVLLDLVHTVEDLGYNLHSESTTLKSALDALEQGPPDVALLDIDVAGQPVWPLARRLKQEGAPIVFISANLTHGELNEEFDGCPTLGKPVSQTEIARSIETALSLR